MSSDRNLGVAADVQIAEAGWVQPQASACNQSIPVTAPWHDALRRYLTVIVIGNLAWEFAHMPLYTIWNTGSRREIVFAAVHCTGGDILIALSSITLALMLVGTSDWPHRRFVAVAALTIAIGVFYTVFSEYLNIVIRAAWAYSELMPVLSVGGLHIGVSPFLQWLVVPLLAFQAARRGLSGHQLGAAARREQEPLQAAIHGGLRGERHASTQSRNASLHR